MDDQRIVEELLDLLAANGVKIKSDALGGRGGGLCQVRGQQVFYRDTEAGYADTAAACAEAVAGLLDVETMYLRPEIRQLIDQYRH